jgi:hypothetical protein
MAGCTTLNRLPPEDRSAAQRDARRVLQQLTRAEDCPATFKGIGRIKLSAPQRAPVSQRAAWVASTPDRLGLVVLAAGRPAVKVAADGTFLYIIDLQDPAHSYTKTPASAGGLGRLVNMPVTVGEVVALLAGRTPVRDHFRAFLQKDRHAKGWQLILESRWRVLQRIYLNAERTSVRRMEVIAADGGILYRVDFEEMQTVAGYRVPRRLALSNDDGSRVQLDVDQYQVDVPVSAAMFSLPPPDAVSPRK